jgi:hypothetical protein
VVLNALLDEGPLEERVRWSQVRASATDLTPVTTAPDENEAIVEAVLVRTAGSGWLVAVVIDNACTGRLTEHGKDSVRRRNLSVELGLRHRALNPSLIGHKSTRRPHHPSVASLVLAPFVDAHARTADMSITRARSEAKIA